MQLNHSPTGDQAMLQNKLPERERLANRTPGVLRSFANSGNRNLTTDELAAELGLTPQSIRKRYSQTGSYFQLCPVKLPNGRLLWPADALEQLISL